MTGPLRNPAFARLWAGGLLSEIGDWLLHISLPLFVLGLTGSPLITALTFMLGLLPSVACAPIAGVLAAGALAGAGLFRGHGGPHHWSLSTVVPCLNGQIRGGVSATRSS